MTHLYTRICPYPLFEATPPGAASVPPVKTGARVCCFRGCSKCTGSVGISVTVLKHNAKEPVHMATTFVVHHSGARRGEQLSKAGCLAITEHEH